MYSTYLPYLVGTVIRVTDNNELSLVMLYMWLALRKPSTFACFTQVHTNDYNILTDDVPSEYKRKKAVWLCETNLIVGIVKENYGFPKNMPWKSHLKTILSQKTVHKIIGTTLQRLKINSKSLNTCTKFNTCTVVFRKLLTLHKFV